MRIEESSPILKLIEENKKAPIYFRLGLFAIRCSATPPVMMTATVVRFFVAIWTEHLIDSRVPATLLSYIYATAMHNIPYPKTKVYFQKNKNY